MGCGASAQSSNSVVKDWKFQQEQTEFEQKRNLLKKQRKPPTTVSVEVSDDLDEFFTSGKGATSRSSSGVVLNARGTFGTPLRETLGPHLLEGLEDSEQGILLSKIYMSLRERLYAYESRRKKDDQPCVVSGIKQSAELQKKAQALEESISMMKTDFKRMKEADEILERALKLRLKADDILARVKEEIELITDADALDAAIELEETRADGEEYMTWQLIRDKLKNLPTLVTIRAAIANEEKLRFANAQKANVILDSAEASFAKHEPLEVTEKFLIDARKAIEAAGITTPGVPDAQKRITVLDNKLKFLQKRELAKTLSSEDMAGDSRYDPSLVGLRR